MTSDTWVAIDFETATASRDSACALGIAVIEDGELAATASWLMRPPGNRYDPRNIAVHGITHALRREDWRLYSLDTILTFFANAFYLGEGVMYYGDGLPPTVTLYGQHVNYLAGALDVVAHELTHGVTDYTSQLIYEGEPGALNEAFSDMMATGVEFYFQPDRADYLAGEDVFTPGGIRSLQNPMAFRDPDHYSKRYTGTDDNGDSIFNDRPLMTPRNSVRLPWRSTSPPMPKQNSDPTSDATKLISAKRTRSTARSRMVEVKSSSSSNAIACRMCSIDT